MRIPELVLVLVPICMIECNGLDSNGVDKDGVE